MNRETPHVVVTAHRAELYLDPRQVLRKDHRGQLSESSPSLRSSVQSVPTEHPPRASAFAFSAVDCTQAHSRSLGESISSHDCCNFPSSFRRCSTTAAASSSFVLK